MGIYLIFGNLDQMGSLGVCYLITNLQNKQVSFAWTPQKSFD